MMMFLTMVMKYQLRSNTNMRHEHSVLYDIIYILRIIAFHSQNSEIQPQTECRQLFLNPLYYCVERRKLNVFFG